MDYLPAPTGHSPPVERPCDPEIGSLNSVSSFLEGRAAAIENLDEGGTAQRPRASGSLHRVRMNAASRMPGRRIPRLVGREEAVDPRFRLSCLAESDARRTDFAPRGVSRSCMSRPNNILEA